MFDCDTVNVVEAKKGDGDQVVGTARNKQDGPLVNNGPLVIRSVRAQLSGLGLSTPVHVYTARLNHRQPSQVRLVTLPLFQSMV